MFATHGFSRRPAYLACVNMRDRCCNPNHESYGDYGGRGIKCCPEWADFQIFFKDMGSRLPGTSLERIDNGGPYAPHNCCWADKHTQANNTRRNVSLTYGGVTKNVAEWSRELGVPLSTLYYRLHAGWDVEEIISGRNK